MWKKERKEKKIWYQQGQTLQTPQIMCVCVRYIYMNLSHWERWCICVKCDCAYIHRYTRVCVCACVFSISAQRSVLQRQTLPPQPLNKPAQQRRERLFRTGPQLSCGQIAYLINVVMEISKKTYDRTLVHSTFALILFSLVFPFLFRHSFSASRILLFLLFLPISLSVSIAFSHLN